MIIQSILVSGGNEELGWRGVLQPEFEKKMKFPIATLATAAIWTCWHLPFWFTKGDMHQDISFAVFFVLCILMSFMLAAIRKRTNCIGYCAIMHGVSNVITSLFVMGANLKLGIGFIIILATAIVLWNSSEENKQET